MKNRRQSVSIRTALSNSVTRKTLYADAFGRRAFLNPVFNEKIHSSNYTSSYVDKSLRDFLASMPSFSDFSDQQLSILETNAVVKNFKSNEIIFKQGEEGDVFYVIHQGSVEVLVQEGGISNSSEDYGISVAKLSQGFYFGERALLTTEPRAATIRALESTQCLVFSRDIFEEVISGSNALIGNDTNDSIDWSKDIETKSLIRHIEKIIEIDNDTTIKPKIKNIVYELNTAFTPELTVDEIVARVVMTVKSAMQADRVGLFILTEDKMNMILKISER
jgi:CRP-like cAMP-binding protein